MKVTESIFKKPAVEMVFALLMDVAYYDEYYPPPPVCILTTIDIVERLLANQDKNIDVCFDAGGMAIFLNRDSCLPSHKRWWIRIFEDGQSIKINQGTHRGDDTWNHEAHV